MYVWLKSDVLKFDLKALKVTVLLVEGDKQFSRAEIAAGRKCLACAEKLAGTIASLFCHIEPISEK